MNPCSLCGNGNYSELVIVTETTFGHGDSTHQCYAKCMRCNNTSREEGGWGLFSEAAFRKAQDNWNNENKPTNST